MTQEKVTAGEASFYLIVDEFKEQKIKGRLYFPLIDRYQPFQTLIKMITAAEEYLNLHKSPQRTHDFRSFLGTGANTEKGSDFTMDNKEGKMPECGCKATFIVKVKYRQNATFQGTIQWLDKNKTQNFRSDLEMLKLIDEALNESEPETPVTWEE